MQGLIMTRAVVYCWFAAGPKLATKPSAACSRVAIPIGDPSEDINIPVDDINIPVDDINIPVDVPNHLQVSCLWYACFL